MGHVEAMCGGMRSSRDQSSGRQPGAFIGEDRRSHPLRAAALSWFHAWVGLAAMTMASGCSGDADEPIGPGGAPAGFWFEQAPPLASPAAGGIGYADGYVASRGDWSGLRVRPGFQGPSLPMVFASGHESAAFILTPTGEVERRWWLLEDHPSLPPFEHPSQKAWRAIQPLPDGGLLAVHEGLCMIRLDSDSAILWSGAPRAHHDFVRLSNDRLAVLDRKKVPLPGASKGAPLPWLSEDGIAILSESTGETLRRASIWEALRKSRWESLATEALANTGVVEVGDGTGKIEKALDPLHANGISLDPKSGELVVFLRDVGALLWLEVDSLSITRVRVGPWVGGHDPQPMPSRPGWWALFDNYSSKGSAFGASRVIATNGLSTEVLYEGSASDPFFSPVCGSVATTGPDDGKQNSPSGWVVTETTQGRAFGLTPSGEIAWEFRTPFRIEEKALIAALLDMRPMPPAIPTRSR